MATTTNIFNYSPAELLNDLCKEVIHFTEAPVTVWLEWACAFNECRLYWVWAGSVGVLGTIVSLLPDDFVYKLQAQQLLDLPTPFMASLGWILYYLRFGVKLYQMLYLPETIDDPDQTKFSLINDLVWATGNLICFFWLCGNAGVLGDKLTTALLLMDVSLSIWKYCEKKAQYTDIINAAPDAATARKAKLDMDYLLYSLFIDCIYAATLCFAFSMVCCFFIPIAAPLALQITGTVLCFALNALFAALNKALEVCKLVQSLNDTNHDQQEILRTYPNLTNDIDRKKAYFDLLTLHVIAEHQQQMITYQKYALLRSVLIDVLVPPAVFLAIVFMPYSIALPLLAVGYLCAVSAYYQIEKNHAPDELVLPDMNDATSQDPLSDEMIAIIITPKTTLGFFSKAANYLQTAPIITTSNSCALTVM